MALLRMSDGRIYTTISDINEQIAPLEVGTFAFSDEARAKMAALPYPLDRAGAEAVVALLDAKTRQDVVDKGYVSWRIGNVVETDGSFEFVLHYESGEVNGATRPGADLKAYLDPHRADVEDIHFVFSGAIVKGLDFGEGLQAVIYVLPGEWLAVGSTMLNWPIFPHGETTVGLSFYSKEAGPGSPWTVERPTFDILPEARF